MGGIDVLEESNCVDLLQAMELAEEDEEDLGLSNL
jgi:hypothetical protein